MPNQEYPLLSKFKNRHDAPPTDPNEIFLFCAIDLYAPNFGLGQNDREDEDFLQERLKEISAFLPETEKLLADLKKLRNT